MKHVITATDFMKYGAIVAFFVGVFSFWALMQDGNFILARYWARYVLYLDRTLRFLHLPNNSKKIVMGQLAAIGAIIAAAVLIDLEYWYLGLLAAIVGPGLYLAQEKKKRIAELELQVDSFILALANGLKTVPSPGAALQAIFPVLRDPTRQEIDRVLKEMRVGSTLEQALMNMSSRIGSRSLDAAMSAVLIGIQVGGNLPMVLETSASSIREMNRLEGVVRTKTSEGRAQLWVLAVFPFILCFMFNWAQPGYFKPLQESVVGYIVTIIAVMFWMASLLVARKVLAVDI